MKKNFFKKKLASALALALVVASVSPISASAATAAKIVDKGTSKATAVLYVDKVSYGKSAVNFDLSKTYAGTKYTWTVSDSKKATIGAKTGYVVAKAPGVVTVKVTAKNTKGKTSTFTQKVEIRQRATAVAAGDDFTLNTGETKALKAVLTPANSTDAVKYVSDKEAVATVDAKTGVVTAVGAGEATITVYAKAASTAPDASQWNVTDTVKVTVPLGVSSIKQNVSNELAVTFNSKIESGKVAASDFSIVNDTTKQVIAVKDAKADGTEVVKLTTFANMTDGKTYTVTYNKKAVQFTATDGVVADLSITPATVAIGTETDVKVSTVDAKGVVLDTYNYGTVGDTKLQLTLSENKGYTNGSKLVLFNIGDTVKATAIYHTYKYDTTGQEVGAIKKELVITAVDKTAVGVSNQEYTIANNAPNWNKYTSNTKIAVKEASTLWLRVKKTDDSYAAAGDYTFSSSNSNVLIVSDLSGSLAANVKAVAEGSTYVLVKDSKGNVVWSLPVTVVAERKASSLLLDKESVTVSTSPTAGETKVIAATLKDQYGDSFDFAYAPSKALITTLAAGVNAPSVSPAADGKISINAVGATTGTYQYRITYGSLERVITVNVAAPSGTTATYELVKSADTIDTVFDGSTTSKAFTVQVAVLKGGVVDGYANISSYEIKNSDNTVVASGTALTTQAVSLAALSVDGSKNVSKLPAGSYSVKLTYTTIATPSAPTTTSVDLYTGFVITDTQSSVTPYQVKTKVASSATVDPALALAYEFYYEGNKITAPTFVNTDADTTVTTPAGVHFTYVRSTYVYVSIVKNSITYHVPVKVNINTTIEH